MTIRLGMLTPSSNTVLEPLTTRILSGLPEVSVHFSRLRVTQIGLDAEALGQFDESPMLAAADLLADAKVDAITWNGTSAGWLGHACDSRLCQSIATATGIRATTSVLALFDTLRRRGENRIGLVTPYTEDVQQAILQNFAREGVSVVAERHSGLRDNFSFAQVNAGDLGGMIAAVAADRPQAIAVLCTNLAAAPLVEDLEARLEVAIYDSVATAVYGALAATGVDPSRVKGFGCLFANG